MLYAQDRWSLLVIFQAMDAAGKDEAFKHGMSSIIHTLDKLDLEYSQVIPEKIAEPRDQKKLNG